MRELHEETGLAADGLVDPGISESFTIAPAWRHRFAWLPWAQALERATSHTNRVAIERVLSARQHAG